MNTRRKPHELTGKHVLFCFIGFFALVFAVNGVMVKAATSTFGGLETTSSYKAGLMFEKEIVRAEQQDALNWQVQGKLGHGRTGETVLDLSARDAGGLPLGGLTAQARLAHPADERLDHVIALSTRGAGQFHGETQARPGQWELIVDLYRDEIRLFRSRSRVTLR